MKVLKLSMLFMLSWALSFNLYAEQWALSLNYLSTNNAGVTEIRGESEQNAAIAATDSNGAQLVCFPFFGIVGADRKFTCWGLNPVSPVTVTANKSLLSLASTKQSSTVVESDLSVNSEKWDLQIDKVGGLFGFVNVSGTSEQGAFISAVDKDDKPLFCFPGLLPLGEEATFSCTGIGVGLPITVTASSGLFSLFSPKVDTSAVATASK